MVEGPTTDRTVQVQVQSKDRHPSMDHDTPSWRFLWIPHHKATWKQVPHCGIHTGAPRTFHCRQVVSVSVSVEGQSRMEGSKGKEGLGG